VGLRVGDLVVGLLVVGLYVVGEKVGEVGDGVGTNVPNPIGMRKE
jgi:hypothetical protein